MFKILFSFKPFLKLKPIFKSNNCFIKSLKMSQTLSQSLRQSMSQSMVNILIGFNDNDFQSNHRLFEDMKTSINEIVGQNKYTVYAITSEEIRSDNGWQLNTALIITVGDQWVDHSLTENHKFNGNHINFKLNDLLIGVKTGGKNDFLFNCEYFKQKIGKYLSNDCKSDLNFNETNESKVYLITKERNHLFVKTYKQLFDTKLRLIDESVRNDNILDQREDNSDLRLDIIVNADLKRISFDTKSYFSNLKSEGLGHCLAFTDITDTTMKLIESFNGINGFVVIANQQTKGRGRYENQWLSPKGCAMFTIQLSIDLNSNIGRKMAFIQHLAGLSVVRAIVTKPGYEGLDLGLKWPNDILWRKTKDKICGVLVTSSFVNRSFNVLIGCGINVCNSRPSVCLNTIIDDYNHLNPDLTQKLDYLKCEEVIARTLTQMESLLKTCEQTNGLQIIEDLYIKHWIHSKEVIKLLDNNNEKMVTIEGLDSDGYLLVRELASDSTLSLHPNGNRFDIMKNLIITRKLD